MGDVVFAQSWVKRTWVSLPASRVRLFRARVGAGLLGAGLVCFLAQGVFWWLLPVSVVLGVLGCAYYGVPGLFPVCPAVPGKVSAVVCVVRLPPGGAVFPLGGVTYVIPASMRGVIHGKPPPVALGSLVVVLISGGEIRYTAPAPGGVSYRETCRTTFANYLTTQENLTPNTWVDNLVIRATTPHKRQQRK